MKDIFKETGIVLFVCVFFAVMLTIFTPYPTSSMVKQLFSNGGPAQPPTNYSEIQDKITVKKDLTYKSLIPENKYDLVLPKEGTNFPVIVWVHGGAYVGGQKEDVSIYANMLAAEGYAVVNFEYDLAPGSRYPGPLIQLNDLYQDLQKVAGNYSLDLSNLYFAGDSAGGQIAAEFVNLQVANPTDQASTLDYLKIVPSTDIKGMILLCAPLSLAEIGKSKKSFMTDFFIKRIGWAYVGEANWEQSPLLKQADLLEAVSPNFPRTFISDGNKSSFEDQGRAFAAKLAAQGTPVTPVFYNDAQTELTHEYQFDLTLPESEATFKALVDFLRKSEN